jgi:hypothetical protein
MLSRQERRAAERAAAKKAPPPKTKEWVCTPADEMIDVTPDFAFVNVPPDLGGGRRKVRGAFLTNTKCPYGSGLVCYKMDGNLRVLRLRDGKLHWIQC